MNRMILNEYEFIVSPLMWKLESIWNICVCVRAASVSLLGLFGKAEVSTVYHFPGTDAPIHHPLSVWFQSVLYLLISPRRAGRPGPGTKAHRKAACLSLILSTICFSGNITHRKTSQLQVMRLLWEKVPLKIKRCPDEHIKSFWKEVIFGHGVKHKDWDASSEAEEANLPEHTYYTSQN